MSNIIKQDEAIEQVSNILSRKVSETGGFVSITQQALEKIASYMPEIDRATNAFGKSQSQTMDLCMTVSALSPYRNLRQILAEIERRRMALKENYFKIKKNNLKLAKQREKLSYMSEETYEKELLKIKIEELESGLADSRVYVEGALKTINSYMQAYNDIKRNFNIPDNWDELSFEQEEEDYHIKKAFEQAHADIIGTGRITQGNHEYLRQMGINPQQAHLDLMEYIQSTEAAIQNSKNSNLQIDSFVKFLYNMAEKYKGNSLGWLKAKGIDHNYYPETMFRDLGV